MLSFDQFDVLGDPIVDLYEQLYITIIKQIAKRLKNLSFESAVYQVQRLQEAGGLYETIIDDLVGLTGKSEIEVRRIFTKAVRKSRRVNNVFYARAGKPQISMALDPTARRLFEIGLSRTNNSLYNIVRTTAIAGKDLFIRVADLAQMQVTHGATDYNTALKNAVKEAAKDGLRWVGYKNSRNRLDTAVRRAMLTGVNQTASEISLADGQALGTDLYQTSAHIGARNKGDVPENHEKWQGRVFTTDPKNKKYPNFYEVTGYGTGAGLAGWNCRHSFFPFFDGISENVYNEQMLKTFADKKVKYKGKEISFYEASQIQRRIERQIREAKRYQIGLEAAGLDPTPGKTGVRKYQAKMRDFIRQTGLIRRNIREQVYDG